MGKGQVTLFIIIGLLIILSIGFLVYTQREALLPVEEAPPRIEAVAPQVQPIADYVTSCLATTTKRAIKQAGNHGGYVYTNKLVSNPIMPIQANALELFEGSGAKVAYWRQLKGGMDCEQKGDCSFESETPSLKSIAHDIEKYTKENIKECLGDFASLKKRGIDVKVRDDAKVKIAITKDNVVAMMEMPVRATVDGEVYDFKSTAITHDAPLRSMYEMAVQLTNLENKNLYLEKAANSLLSLYQGRGTRLPPTTDVKVETGPGEFWLKTDVEEAVVQLLSANVPLIQVVGTKNYQYVTSEEDVRDEELFEILFNRNYIIPLEHKHPELGVSFSYMPNWKPYFNLDCKGIICQPEVVKLPAVPIPIGIQRYQFGYDLSYPVLIDITSPEAFGGEGFSFKIALQSHIRDNKPLSAEYRQLTAPTLTPQSLFCDLDKRTKAMNLTVTDTQTAQPIDEVDVAYACANEICTIGSTTKGKLNANLPACLGGKLKLKKEKYESLSVPYDTTVGKVPPMKLFMHPEVKLNVSIKKYLWRKGGTDVDFTNLLYQPSYETTVITAEKHTAPDEEPFIVQAQVTGGIEQKGQSRSTNIAFLPGDYTVIISSYANPDPAWIIPPHQRCYRTCKGIPPFRNCDTKCQYIPNKPIIFNSKRSVPTGQATFNWTITADDLRKATNVEFHNIVYYLSDKAEKRNYTRTETPPNTIEDLNRIAEIEMQVESNLKMLEPKFR